MYVCEWNMNNRRICTSRNREAKPFKGINEAQTHDDFHPDSLNNEQSLWIRPQLAQRKTTQMLKCMQAAWPPFVSRAEEPKFFSSYKLEACTTGPPARAITEIRSRYTMRPGVRIQRNALNDKQLVLLYYRSVKTCLA